MNKKTWLLIIFGLLMAILLVLLLSAFGVRKRVDIAQTRGDSLYRLYGDKRVGQTFIVNEDNLNIIVLDLKNSALRNKEPIYFRLEETKTATNLREIQINGRNVGDPSSIRFQFDPVSDSVGRSYYFYLESPTSTEEDAIEVYHSTQNLYSEGEMILDGQSAVGELRFVSYYYPESKKAMIGETINDLTSRFLNDKSFVFFYLILLFSVFCLSMAI